MFNVILKGNEGDMNFGKAENIGEAMGKLATIVTRLPDTRLLSKTVAKDEMSFEFMLLSGCEMLIWKFELVAI